MLTLCACVNVPGAGEKTGVVAVGVTAGGGVVPPPELSLPPHPTKTSCNAKAIMMAVVNVFILECLPVPRAATIVMLMAWPAHAVMNSLGKRSHFRESSYIAPAHSFFIPRWRARTGTSRFSSGDSNHRA